MTKKTYGAAGYMDWVAMIPAGSSKVNVHFTGGALTTYGITPAEFTTDNAFFQRVIEGSDYYKDGRITLLRQVEIAGPALPAAAAPEAAAPEAAPEAAEPQPETATTEEAAAAAELTPIEVSCLADAQQYLSEHYGVSTYKVRTRPTVQAAAATHGIVFTGI